MPENIRHLICNKHLHEGDEIKYSRGTEHRPYYTCEADEGAKGKSLVLIPYKGNEVNNAQQR